MTALLLGVLMQKSFQQNSGMLRQTKLVIFSQTASLLLMNAAGRVSVSPAEITLNTGNMCPLWVGEHNKPDRQTYIGRQRGKLASVIWIFRGQMLNTTTGEFEIELFFKYVHYVLKIRVTVKKKKMLPWQLFSCSRDGHWDIVCHSSRVVAIVLLSFKVQWV